jgi:hypothetical protein
VIRFHIHAEDPCSIFTSDIASPPGRQENIMVMDNNDVSFYLARVCRVDRAGLLFFFEDSEKGPAGKVAPRLLVFVRT